MKIKLRSLLCSLLLFVLVQPLIVSSLGWLNNFFYFLKFIAAVAILCSYLVHFQLKLSKFMLLITAYSGIEITMTYINSGNMFQSLGSAVNLIATLMLTEIMLAKGFATALEPYIQLLDFYLLLNSISLVLFPNGIVMNDGQNWILGIDNRFVFYYLPLVCFRTVYSVEKYGAIRFSDVFVYAVCTVTLLIRWAVGGMIGLLLYIPFFLLIGQSKSRVMERLTSPYSYTLYWLLANYLVIFFQIQSYLVAFLTDVLQKDATFSSRTIVWSRAINYIASSPLIGAGKEDSQEIISKIGAPHAHNQLLDCLYRGGTLYLVIYILILFLVAHTLKRNKHKLSSRILAFSIFSILVMSIFDSAENDLYYVILLFAYHSDMLRRGCPDSDMIKQPLIKSYIRNRRRNDWKLRRKANGAGKSQRDRSHIQHQKGSVRGLP